MVRNQNNMNSPNPSNPKRPSTTSMVPPPAPKKQKPVTCQATLNNIINSGVARKLF